MSTRKRDRTIDRDILEFIAELAHQGVGASEILRLLKREEGFKGRLPELRTIQRVVQDIRGRLTLWDDEFQWHKLEDYGIPWEASDFLLDMWALARRSVSLPIENFKGPFLSAREVRWWWRIHLADSYLEMTQVVAIAQLFVVRELVYDALRMPLQMADLEALLAFKPWRNEDYAHAYFEAVKEGRIPPIKDISTPISTRLLMAFPVDTMRRYIQSIVLGSDPSLFLSTVDGQNKGGIEL